MWLVPAFSALANAAGRVYYRLTIAGERVPANGSVLLVANHPNSLIDPILVCAAARRPVRFLAKAPLFSDRKTGWLMRAVGAIPVYRRADDPALVERNVDAFRAVHRALARGAAVGIFPEGASHSEPALLVLKTGAARIALGAYRIRAHAFPIVPVGLVFRRKDRFRSRAQVIVGRPVAWEDLAPRGLDDPQAVHTFTERIGGALRDVTVNLERWADAPLVECAHRIWEAEHGGDHTPAARVARLGITSHLLGELRRDPDPRWRALIRDVETHCRRLERLRVTPAALHADTGVGTGLRWAVRRAYLLLPLGVLVAAAGFLLFWVPFRATGLIVSAVELGEDERSTWKLLVGIAVYGAWVLALAVLAALTWGPGSALAALLMAPALGMLGLTVRERWRGAWGDARRFLLLRARGALVASLRAEQEELARRLRALYDERVARRTA